MPLSQSSAALRLITDALQQPVGPETWSAIARQMPDGTIIERLLYLGGQLEITFLERPVEADALPATVRRPGGPMVLLPGKSRDTSSIVVLAAEDAPSPWGWEITTDGTVKNLDAAPLAERAAVIRRLLGDNLLALSPLRVDSIVKRTRPDIARALPGEGAENDQYADGAQGAVAFDERVVGLESNAVSRLWSLLMRDRREVIVVFFYAGLAGLFSLTLPIAVGGIVQLIQGGLLIQSATVLITYAIAATIVVGVLQIMQLRVVERIQQRVFARMALEFTYRLTRIKYEVSLRDNLQESMNRMFEAVNIQKSLAKFLLDTSQALLTIVFGLALLSFYHPYFLFFGALLILALVVTFWITGPRGLGTSLLESKYKYITVHWLEEVARAFHAFKFGGRSRLALERMDGILTSYLKFRQRHFRVLIQQTVAMVFFKTVVLGGMLILGTVLVVNRQISLGQFVAAEIVLVTVLAGVEKLVFSLSVVYDMLTAVEKAGLVADYPLEEGGASELPDRPDGLRVDARDLRYTYRGGDTAVQSVSLSIERGENVALSGFKGAGRSTLLRLLGGLLENYEGSLLFDGRNVRELDREALRGRIGQVMSLSDLFDGTIQENVSVGRPGIDEAAVHEALRLIGLEEDIQALPMGIKTPIAHGGRSLPSHVALKLLIAQGIAGQPRLILFDDLFMNLPHGDRDRLLTLLTDKDQPWTVIAVSHDRKLLEKFDRVIVLEDGGVVADGPLDTLQADPYVATLLRETLRSTDRRDTQGDA